MPQPRTHASAAPPRARPRPAAAEAAPPAAAVAMQPAARIAALQRTVGNQAVTRMVERLRTAPAPEAVRRKVGFEFEIKHDLRKARVPRDWGTSKKKQQRIELDDDEEQFIGLGSKTPLLTSSSLGYGSATKSSSSGHPGVRDLEAVDGTITKGEEIVTGTNWRLTPDGGGDDWYPEYITSPIDETTNPEGISAAVAAVGKHLTDTVGQLRAWEYAGLPHDYVMSGGRMELHPQATVGVRLDAVLRLAEALATAPRRDSDSDEKRGSSDDEVRLEISEVKEDDVRDSLALLGSVWEPVIAREMGGAVAAAKQATGGLPKRAYQGLVALMGSYVRGLQVGRKPSTAKLNVPVLSRTNLGYLRKQVVIPDEGQFLADVLAAGGVDDGGTPLFPYGLTGEGAQRGRSIDLHEELTIAAWVRGIMGEQDYEWSGTKNSAGKAFKLEDVGESWKEPCFCGLFSVDTRAQGAILELRHFDPEKPLAPKDAVRFAEGVVAAVVELNRGGGL